MDFLGSKPRRSVSWFSLEEGNSVVVGIEEGVVLSHEHITEDEVVEALGEFHGGNTHDTLRSIFTTNLKDVILMGKSVCDIIEGKENIGEAFDTGAVALDSDTLNKGIGDGGGSNHEGGTGVNDGEVTSGINGIFTILLHGGKVNGPVSLLNNFVDTKEFLIEILSTWDEHVRLFGVGSKVERERFVL